MSERKRHWSGVHRHRTAALVVGIVVYSGLMTWLAVAVTH